jgi:rhodanese-related sulfurtransferase
MARIPEIEPAELATVLYEARWLLLDVREPWELDIASIQQAVGIPLGLLPERHGELPDDRVIAVICHSGQRSARAAAFLLSRGYAEVYNVTGGIDRWSLDVDPAIARY